MSPPSWAARAPPPTSGWPASAPKGPPAWPIGQAGPTAARTAPRPACRPRILQARQVHRRGADWIDAELGIPASTVGRVIARAGLPALADLDALTGEPVRRGPASRVRYERARPGELVHLDVKRVGRIPDGGGWRAHGRAARPNHHRGPGFDYVHSAVDDHSRLAYSEIHPDERGATCAGFLARAAAHFGQAGIGRIERVMTDNHLSYRRSAAFAAALRSLGARHVLIRPHCPWTNGKESSASSAPSCASGPTRRSSPATPSGRACCQTGSSTTTPGAATARSAAFRRSAACQQRW